MKRRVTTPMANHLRRRAKAIKKALGVTLSGAQEAAAREAGFANWHAFITKEKRQANVGPITAGHAANISPRLRSISYHPMFPARVHYRPPVPMALAVHKEVGLILKRLRALSRVRAGVHQRLATVASTLDDWLLREHENSLRELNEVYYGDSGGIAESLWKLSIAESDQFSAEFDKLERLLLSGYPNCAARNRLLREIHFARKALQRWLEASQPRPAGTIGVRRKRREIPPVPTTKAVAEMTAAEAVEHAMRLLSSYLQAFGTDWRRSARRAVLCDRMRLELPYVVHETGYADTFILVNRDYKPVGVASNDHVDYGEYPNLHIRLNDDALKGVTKAPHKYGLFDDGCPPWRKRVNAEAYLERLRRLHRLIA